MPLLIVHPDYQKPVRPQANVSTIDIFPTVMDMVGGPDIKELEGKSLMPLITGGKNKFEKRFLYSYLWKQVRTEVEFRATIYKNLHFILTKSGRRELFNFKTDKRESNNGIGEGAKVAKNLEIMFHKFFSTCKKYKGNIETIKLDKKKLEELKSLGYVE